MKQQIWKIKLGLLWIFVVINYTALLFIELAVGAFTFPTNDSTAEYIVFIFYFIPCLMAWLSLVLKPSTSRWLNIVLASMLFILKFSGAVGIVAASGIGTTLNEFVAVILTALIIWYGWKSPDTSGSEIQV